MSSGATGQMRAMKDQMLHMDDSMYVIDCAGGNVGGAARFLRELDAYAGSDHSTQFTTIGRGRFLTPTWMAQREVAARRFTRRVALNNASFVGGSDRTVLLRNALHFATRDEMDALGHTPTRTFQAQIGMVRSATLRASRIIVPSTAMGERVIRHLPSVESRVVVRFHPVTVTPQPGRSEAGRILVPIVPSPYKNLDQHAQLLLSALDASGTDATLVFTATEEDLPTAYRDPRVTLIGVQSSAEIEDEWARATAVFFPTALEAFGYPLAEARALGRRILALDTPQNREIAGQALAGYAPGDVDSLGRALAEAVARSVEPDPSPFDRQAYFDWLLRP